MPVSSVSFITFAGQSITMIDCGQECELNNKFWSRMADDLWPYRFKNKQKLQRGTKRTSLLKSKNRTPAKKTWSSNWQKSCIWLRAGLKYFKAMFCFDWRTRPRRQFFSPETEKVASNYKLAEDRATFNQQPNKQKRKSLKCLFWNFWHDLKFFFRSQ